MNTNEKSYIKQSLECVLGIFFILIVFFGIIVLTGEFNGMSWISYLSSLISNLNTILITFLF